MTQPFALQEIDRAVDHAIDDKDRAARLKKVLHQQFEVSRPGRRHETAAFDGFADEAEEFWDNVPV